MLLTKPRLVLSVTVRLAAQRNKGVFIVCHGAYNDSSTAAHGIGVRLRPRQDHYLTKAAAQRNFDQHIEPLTARYYNKKPQQFFYTAEEVAKAVAEFDERQQLMKEESHDNSGI